MKQLVAVILSWILFYVGDLTSKVMIWFDWGWLYPIYNDLMNKSWNIQEWGCINSGPWKTDNEDN